MRSKYKVMLISSMVTDAINMKVPTIGSITSRLSGMRIMTLCYHSSARLSLRRFNAELGTTALIVTHDPAVSEHVQRTVQIRDGRTATEVLRWTHTDDDGREHAMAEEFVVLDRVGRMQLPADYLTSLGLRDRVRLQLQADHVAVRPGHEGSASRGGAGETRGEATDE